MNNGKDLIDGIHTLYLDTKRGKRNKRIIRGTSPSISAKAEENFARYLDGLMADESLCVWIDPQIVCDTLTKETASGKKKKVLFRPDMCVVRPGAADSAKVLALFELKLNLGYIRGFDAYAKERADLIKSVRKDTAHCGIGGKKYRLSFDPGAFWNYVVFSEGNIGKAELEGIRQKFGARPKLGRFYVLSRGDDLSLENARYTTDTRAFTALEDTIKTLTG
jgi:hypothetical protein